MADKIKENMQFKEDTRYTAAVARIRSLETHFLTSEKIQRIIDTQDINAVWREIVLWCLLPHPEPGNDIFFAAESFYAEEVDYANKLFFFLSKDAEISKIFRYKYDFHNLKVFINEKKEEKQNTLSIVDLGSISPENIKKAVLENKLDGLPKKIAEVFKTILAAVEYHKKNNNFLFPIDTLVDKAMYEFFFQLLKENPVPAGEFIEIIFKLEIAIKNLDIASRFRILKKDPEVLKDYLFPDQDSALLIDKFKSLEENAFIDFCSQASESKKKKLQNHLDSNLYTAFGMEPIVAFLKRREREALLLRAIFLAKAEGFGSESIQNLIKGL